MKPGINTQDGALTTADVGDLTRFGSALVIAAWEPPTETLAVLHAASVGVGLWRFTEDPRNMPGWPDAFLSDVTGRDGHWSPDVKRAVFANEVDQEGPVPSWYGPVCDAWQAAGGQVGEPAWSDESKRAGVQRTYDFITAHVYPKGRGAANLAACRARANGRPVIVTEAGDATAPASILLELEQMGVTEETFLYTYRALDQQAQPAYNLAGIPLQSRQDAPGSQGGTPVASLPIPLENQLTSDGPNKYNECGPACIRMVMDYFGLDMGDGVDAIDVAETGSEQYVGYTTTQQMVAWFAARGVPAVQSQPSDVAAAIAANLARGWPCIWLGYWDRANLTGGHFELPVSVGNAGAVTLNNPYGGVVETLSAADLNRYSLGWLVTIKATKEDMQMANDPIEVAAVARFSALGVQPNTDGALFKAYKRMVAAWLANGQDGVLDPTPVIAPEAVTPDGQHAYLLLDSGRVLHWRKDTGLVYQAEYRELPTIFYTTGWGRTAA